FALVHIHSTDKKFVHPNVLPASLFGYSIGIILYPMLQVYWKVLLFHQKILFGDVQNSLSFLLQLQFLFLTNPLFAFAARFDHSLFSSLGFFLLLSVRFAQYDAVNRSEERRVGIDCRISVVAA